MSMDNIRLKQEDVFGEHSVLTDINPVTNTKSIDDDASGEKLDDTLNRLWQAINNKLSRIVNSVNGRTGVVVLTSDDVGLGNVDNVSFADIKSWVIEQIENAFENKQLRLYDTYDRVIEAIDANDKTMSWSPFYCDMYGNNDRRAVIGLFKWNPSSAHLDAEYRLINTIGYSDGSIVYRASQSDYNPGAPGEQDYEKYSDIPVGGIGVNIYKEERPDDQILYLEGARTGVPKGQAGLRLDHDKIGSRLYYEDTPYGDSDNLVGAAGYMLWRYGSGDAYKGYAVRIFIDDDEIVPSYWMSTNPTDEVISGDTFFIDNRWVHYNTFRNNDVIIMRFGMLCTTESNTSFVSGMCQDFSNRQPAIATVIKASDSDSADYIIKFYSLIPNTDGYGVGTLINHLDRTVHSSQLCIDITKSKATPDGKYDTGGQAYENAFDINMSGVNAICKSMPVSTSKEPFNKYHQFDGITIFPLWGIPMYPKSGLFVTGDGTISTYSRYQAQSTINREGNAPHWIADTYYSYNGSTYVLTTREPRNWEYQYYTYYTKNPDDSYTRVKGSQPSYSLLTTDGDGEEVVNKNKQVCVGSRLSSNFAFNWNDDYTTTQTREAGLSNPTGLNPEDGTLGTQSVLSVNLRKFSSFRTGDSSDITYDSFTKTGYQLFNISGLKVYGAYRSEYVGTSRENKLAEAFIEDLGIPDFIDVNNHDLSKDIYPGGTTVGIGINPGQFLEITPKRTYRAEKYWDGGKVQVRTGKGITEQFEMIDITDIIREENVPAEYNFTYDYLRDRYIMHSDEFYAKLENGSTWRMVTEHNQIVEDETHKPSDWDTDWYRYEYNIGTAEDPDYVCLPYDPDNPVGFFSTDPNYMGPYYKRFRQFESLNKIHVILVTGVIPYANYKYFWKRPTNRMTIDVDPNTLSFDTRGKLTVVGGVNSTETTNIRFIDSAGIYADTYSGDIDEAHTEGVRIGDGLKLNGTAITLPSDVVLLNSVESNTRLKSVVDEGMSAYELARFFYTFGDRFDINVPTTNTMTATWLRTQQPSLSDKIAHLPYVNVGNTKSDAKDVMSFNQSVHSALQRELNDRTEITFSDPTYNIPETSFVKGDLRTYMSGTISEVLTRATNIVQAIRTYVENPDDANKVEQYVANHYNLGTVASNDDLVEKLSSIPMFTDHHLEDHLPFDWMFSLFTTVILAKGKWSNIVAGEFRYTQLQHRPADWEPSGYASYFLHNTGSNVYEVLTPISIEYHPGMFYIRNNETGEFSLVTDDTATQETILASYYFQNTFSLMTSDTEPANWTTDWTLYYTTSDETSAKRFNRVNTETPPTWEANKYYVMATNGDVVGYEKVTAAPPFENGEKGTTGNSIISAPDWEANTFYRDDQGTLTETRPDNWFTNYGDYYRKIGDNSYEHVSGYHRSFRTYTGPYSSRELVINS